MSSMNYAKTLELYVQECIRQLMQGKNEEEIKEEAIKALGSYLNDKDKEVFVSKMLARAKVRLILSKIPDLDDSKQINTKTKNMLLDGSRNKSNK